MAVVASTLALDALCETLVARLAALPGIHEGAVNSTARRRPYRRIDCDGRALLYVYLRPRRGAVRLDVSGLWLVERGAPIRCATGTGSATLFVSDERQIGAVVQYVEDAVRRTRTAYAEEAARRTRPSGGDGRAAARPPRAASRATPRALSVRQPA